MAFSIQRGLVVLTALTALSVLLTAGCQDLSTSHSDATPQTQPAPLFGLATNASQKGGAQLWAETCSHCHNLRSPSSYGPYQWEVAVYDMRVRAHLTGEEQRKITAFLKAASQ